jgi:hypothetical protein
MYGEPLSGPTDVERSNVENPFHQLRLERLRFLRSIPGYRHHSRTRSHVCVVRGQQPAEAVPGRRGSGNGIKRRGMGPFYTKLPRKPAISYQRDYCLRAPDRTPALQTAEPALAKRYARHTPSRSVPQVGFAPAQPLSSSLRNSGNIRAASRPACSGVR